MVNVSRMSNHEFIEKYRGELIGKEVLFNGLQISGKFEVVRFMKAGKITEIECLQRNDGTMAITMEENGGEKLTIQSNHFIFGCEILIGKPGTAELSSYIHFDGGFTQVYIKEFENDSAGVELQKSIKESKGNREITPELVSKIFNKLCINEWIQVITYENGGVSKRLGIQLSGCEANTNGNVLEFKGRSLYGEVKEIPFTIGKGELLKVYANRNLIYIWYMPNENKFLIYEEDGIVDRLDN